MDMNELTREELDARIDSIENRIDRRFAEADAKAEVRFAAIDARFAEADAKANVRFAEVDARFAEAEARAEKRNNDLIKWMVGTGLAAAALGGGAIGLVINSITTKPATPIVITVPAPSQPAPPG
jgi:anti-sigma-K factor RskA